MVEHAQTEPQPQVEEYSFSKDKLRKGLSYPLKRSLLDAALRTAAVYDTIWYVRYSARQYNDLVLEAYFGPEPHSYAASGKVMVDVLAVPSRCRKATEELLVAEGLPVLCRWLARVRAEGNAWRSFGHSLKFQRVGGALRTIEE